jgi:hypothetical protein
MSNSGDPTDLKHRAYGLILRYGVAALARVWHCPKTLIYQIVNESVGSSWLHNAAVARVRTLGARELAHRAGVPARQILIALESGIVPDALALFVASHTESGTEWSYPDTPNNEGLN